MAPKTPKAPKKKGKGKKKASPAPRTKQAAAGLAPDRIRAANWGPATAGEPSSGAAPEAAPGPAGPKPGDRGKLVGLLSRPELNGRRVEVWKRTVRMDGAPRFRVRLLFGAGAGSEILVRARDLRLDNGDNAVEPEAGDTAELVGLRGRADLNGKRVEVEARAVGQDGAPCFIVRLGDGEVVKVKAANLELDTDGGLDPAVQTLVEGMQALAPGALPPEERRDWARGLPIKVLAKIAKAHVAQTEAGWVAMLNGSGCNEEEIQEIMAKRKRAGRSRGLFVFAMVCKGWRKFQLKVKGRMPTRVKSDVILPGRAELAKWALAEGCPRESEDGEVTLASAAAIQGHLELVQWLCGEGGFAMDEQVMKSAAASGNLEVVQWLRGEGCEWGEGTCASAAGSGQLKVLKWLRGEGCPWDWRTANGAVRYGSVDESLAVEVLQWLHANGCPWNSDAVFYAVERGLLEVLKFLRANNCPWHWRAMGEAVRKGHVEMLHWGRANGAPWTAAIREVAAEKLGYTDDLGNLLDTDEA